MVPQKKDPYQIHNGKKPLMILLSIFVLILIVFFLFLIRNENKKFYYIGKTETRDTITISGQGKVTAIPDIATVSFGIMKENVQVSLAQREVNENMNSFIDQLKGINVEEDDITTTNYSINPVYDWDDGKRILRGYQVSQNIEVKIRNLDNIGQILNLAVEKGLNEVSGLSFEIEDPEELRQEARELALENAKEKAEELADIADVKLGKVITFSETEGAPAPVYDYYKAEALGTGADFEEPEIQAGTTEIIINVTVSYEIL